MAFDISAYQEILHQLNGAATLVAVSKTKPHTDIKEAYECGVRDFGENYVQELLEKQPILPQDIRWHFIGHLQSNKVKYIAPFVHLIHGVDKLGLLDEIQKQALKNQRTISVLIQVHVASEETKFGFSPQEAIEIFTQLDKSRYSQISFCGIMAMATFTNDQSQLQREFSAAKEVFDTLAKVMGNDWQTLSMGMSSDWNLAVAAGSTLIRLGSTLFGSRN